MRVVVIGATGLVGKATVDRLLADGTEVHAIGRTSGGKAHPLLHDHVASADNWTDIVRQCRADAALSALGTTWRAAGSEDAFRAVDLGMVIAFAKSARQSGVGRMLTVSAIGANASSRNFYLRVKGEMEQALEAVGFDRLDVMHPGLLRGNRGDDRRLAERLGIVLSPLTNLVMRGRLARFAAIDAAIVADASAACLRRADAGVFRHDNLSLKGLAREYHTHFN